MSRSYPGVRKVKSKTGDSYEISWYPFPGAKRRQIRITASSLKEAFLIRTQRMAESDSRNKAVPDLSFAELKERLRLKFQADKNAPKTIVNYMGKFKTLFEKFLPQHYPRVKSVNRLNQEIMERYKQYIVVDQSRKHGWRDELTKLKSIFGKMVAIGCCDERIVAEVLSKFEKPDPRAKVYKEITKEQKQQLLIYIKEDRPDLYGITYLIMRLGWRRGQVISLQRSDIKFNGLKPVEIVCQPHNTKNKKPHILRGFGSDVTEVLQHYYQASKGSDWLFPNRKGNRVHANNYTNYITKTSLKVLNVRLTPHDFRHMFCTHMKKLGLPERDIMSITGHQDIKSFQIYTHATTEGIKRVLDSGKIF